MKLKHIIGIEYIFHEVTITEIGMYSVVYFRYQHTVGLEVCLYR